MGDGLIKRINAILDGNALQLACFGNPIPRVTICPTVYKTTGSSVLVCAFTSWVVHDVCPYDACRPVSYEAHR